MAKSRAEIQKAYRERKKAAGPDFLENERKRARTYRVPVASLPTNRRELVRKRNRTYFSTHYEKKKQTAQPEEVATPIRDPSLGTTPTRNTRSTPLVVNFEFSKRNESGAKGGRTRVSHALGRANQKIKDLGIQLDNANRYSKKVTKRNERLMKKINSPQPATKSPVKPGTPRTKARRELRLAGISPKKTSKRLYTTLVMGNAVVQEVAEAVQSTSQQAEKNVLGRIISGRIAKRARCISRLQKSVKLTRPVWKAQGKRVSVGKRRDKSCKEIHEAVHAFYEQDDVSRMMPGKKDAKKDQSGRKQQTRILNDYLGNLHQKFMCDHPNMTISKSLFYSLRPKHVLLTKYLSRDVCLCSKHQNIALKLKALSGAGIQITCNPEEAARSITVETLDQLMTGLPQEEVSFEEWKRVETNGKKKMKLVSMSVEKEAFVANMKSEYADFLLHVHRVQQQFAELLALKTNLPETECVIQMDFAENFLCQSSEEIQSAYWNNTSVTLHPIVVYYREGDSLQHHSFIMVSNDTSHNSTSVYAILQKIIPTLKERFNVSYVHYWTDSPTSQYRNKTVFNVVLQHENLFGIQASWDYFEAGHGKGPCDGLGGTSKRQASEAVRQGKAVIQDAADYFAWASNTQQSIEYIYYSSDDCSVADSCLTTLNPQAIPGTMKVHAVKCSPEQADSTKHLCTRETSCYCNTCLAGGCCASWTHHIDVTKDAGPPVLPEMDAVLPEVDAVLPEVDAALPAVVTASQTDPIYVDVDDWLATIYEHHWYVGKVLEKDDSDVKVTFMAASQLKGGQISFRWPKPVDELWVPFQDVLCKVAEPRPQGRSGRVCRLTSDDLNVIKAKFDMWNAK